MKLLIVENSPSVRRVIRSIVATLADEVYECEDGADALQAYIAHKPDWVLMDIAMNNVDGIAATKSIKDQYPDAKIIIVTNFDDADLREAALQAGACGYVLKDNLYEAKRMLKDI
ncbi:MAG TPA: response regulator transcription factor [Blastocatellia bacterium]|nr:response regulator transcription factor [Blastocatellia bacterium]